MTFEVFRRPRASREGLLVTVQTNGGLRLNAAAQRAINQPTHVLLVVDQTAGKVGVKPAVMASPVTFRLLGNGVVSAAEFVRFTGLTPGRYPAEFADEMLVVTRG